ncbi:UNVERIFIED_ORG: NlpC/P60 family protein [Bacillus sp. AZ43]
MSARRRGDMSIPRLWSPHALRTVDDAGRVVAARRGWPRDRYRRGPGAVRPTGPARRANRAPTPLVSGVPRAAAGERKESHRMVTTRPNSRLRTRRLGAGLLTGAAASLAIGLAPGAAVAAEPAPAPAASSTAAPSAAAQTAVDTARAQVGKAYEYGGAGPDTFDCSGLTQYAYRAAGIELPHSSRSQSEMGTPVSRDQLLPGDLVFFYEPVSHVGIYVGDGQMVDAGNESTGVSQRSVDMEGYSFARRIA